MANHAHILYFDYVMQLCSCECGRLRSHGRLCGCSQLRELKKPSMTGDLATGIQRLPDEISDIILGACSSSLRMRSSKYPVIVLPFSHLQEEDYLALVTYLQKQERQVFITLGCKAKLPSIECGTDHLYETEGHHLCTKQGSQQTLSRIRCPMGRVT